MSDIFLTEQGASLHKYGESLLLRKEGKKLFEIELKNVDTVQIFGNIQISTQLIKDFMDREIELAFYTMSGELLGQITPPHVKNVAIRYKQYDLSKDASFCLEFSKEIFRAKMESSIFFLREAQKNRDELDISSGLKKLKEWRSKLEELYSQESLLGTEGSFAREYYEIYGKFFKTSEFFQGRSKRPPKDEGNAILSFLYTLVTNRVSAYIDGIGFDPYIGFYHKMQYGRISLGCDLVEPIRALFCDRLTLKIFHYYHFKKEDFETREGGVYLKRDSQKKFFAIYGKEFLADYNYGLINGSLQRFMEELLIWLRACIKEGNVTKIGGKH